ncbi:MAG: hypothetical protein AB8G99_04010 [Planctomycetaceae bacterium]
MLSCLLIAATCLPQESPPKQKAKPPAKVVFSGPQVGEKVVALPVRIKGEKEPVDLVKRYGSGPLQIVFFHKLTRPSFQLTREIARVSEFVGKADKLKTVVVFLSDDPPAIEKQVQNIQRLMGKTALVGVSTDGSDGPGAYGLNRNVLTTVLVTDKQKVVANFALTQPSLKVDGPKIAAALAKVLGVKKVPDITRVAGMRQRRTGGAGQSQDPNLRPLLQPFIQKTNTVEQTIAAAKKIENYVAKNPVARGQVGDICRRIIKADKLANYGTAECQGIMKSWAKDFQPPKREPGDAAGKKKPDMQDNPKKKMPDNPR